MTYKDGYEKLDEAFLERNSQLEVPGMNRFNSYEPKEAVVATKKVRVLYTGLTLSI